MTNGSRLSSSTSFQQHIKLVERTIPSEKLAATSPELRSGSLSDRASAELSRTGSTMVIVMFLRKDVPHAATISKREKVAPRLSMAKILEHAPPISVERETARKPRAGPRDPAKGRASALLGNETASGYHPCTA